MRSFCILFGVFLLIYCNECTNKYFPLFIYDNRPQTTENETEEMYDFMFNFCSSSRTGAHMTRLYDSKLDKTSNSSTIPTTTTTPINGQNVLHALLGNLEDYPPYTQIYVITFAPTTFSDEDLIGKILEQIQIKRSQVNFFIRGEYPSGIDYLKEYSLITSVGNGVTWRSFEFNQFTDWKSLELNAMLPKANLLTIYDTDNGTYCMTIDSLLETDIKDMIFSSFDSNEYEVTVTLSREPNRTTLVNEKEKDAENTIQTITTKEMCVEVRRKFQNSDLASFYTLRGFSKSEFDFYYGFSTDNVTSLNETYRRPIKGKSNKIYVSSYSENTRYGFDHFKILFLNGTSSGETISFEPIPDTDLFVGSFEPPNKEYFYIQVTTYANGETISRMSHTAMNTADEFGEEKQNPTFERKPIVYRGYSRSKIFVEIQKETQKEIQKEYNSIGLYNTIGIIIIAIMLLIVLPFIWATIFRLYYQPPERSERGRGVSEPLGIEKARRRAMPNDYHIMHVSQV
ncbi:hemicentin-1-like [Planococcus citri]|uniref:hemicentin-1-like n=1 Tax=Planococcus citri TaxID=170843 RepID=UPI0031F7A957